jgi:hypothetical protein
VYRKPYGLPIADLISEANVGLMQAVKRFEPEKGVRLATYAMWWIKATVHEYILKSWSIVKIGTTAAQKKMFFNPSSKNQTARLRGAAPHRHCLRRGPRRTIFWAGTARSKFARYKRSGGRCALYLPKRSRCAGFYGN